MLVFHLCRLEDGLLPSDTISASDYLLTGRIKLIGLRLCLCPGADRTYNPLLGAEDQEDIPFSLRSPESVWATTKWHSMCDITSRIVWMVP